MKKIPATGKMSKDHLVINGKKISRDALFPFLVRTNPKTASKGVSSCFSSSIAHSVETFSLSSPSSLHSPSSSSSLSFPAKKTFSSPSFPAEKTKVFLADSSATPFFNLTKKKVVCGQHLSKHPSTKKRLDEKDSCQHSLSGNNNNDNNLAKNNNNFSLNNNNVERGQGYTIDSFSNTKNCQGHPTTLAATTATTTTKTKFDHEDQVLDKEEFLALAIEEEEEEEEEEVTIPKNTKFGVDNGYLDWKQTQFVRQTGFCQDFQVENVSSRHKVSFCNRKKKNSVHDIYLFLKNRNVHHTVLETTLNIYRSTCEKMGVVRNHLKMGVVAASVFKAYTIHNNPQDFNDLMKELNIDLKLANRGLRCINMNNDEVRVVMNTAKQEMAVVLKLLEIADADKTDKIFANFDDLFSLCANVVDFSDYRIFCVILLYNLGYISNMKKTCTVLRVNMSSLKKLNSKIELFLHVFNKNQLFE